jgi:hypothetical protein
MLGRSESPSGYRATPPRETLGLSCLARHQPRFATTRVLAGPNGSEWARTPQKERGGSPLDGFGHIRVKRIELQLEATRDGGQTDLAI